MLVEGIIALQVMLSNQPCVKTMEFNFLILSTHSSFYNAILGRHSLNKIGAIISNPNLLMKFPTNQGKEQVKVNQQLARRCYMASLTKTQGVREGNVE